MQRFNKKGFTLIELMVVVGIIGVIALIAVPNFQRFQGKAKQAHAKTELASIYGMQKAFFTEFGQYHSNLYLVGYTPDGYPTTGTPACPVINTTTATGSVRYYRTGFGGAGTADNVVSGITAIPCPGTYAYLNTVSSALIGLASTSVCAPTTFLLEASGVVAGAGVDEWTMTDGKILTNSSIGF